MVGLFCKFKLQKVIVMDLSVRKTMRLQNYNYSENGAYYVTICTKNRRCLFSEVVGSIYESTAKIKLKPYGRIVDEIINTLSERFDINIDNYVIMPNHIHMIISIENSSIKRSIRESTLRNRSTISKVVGYLKMNSSKMIHEINPDENVWQSSYYDHIIRDENDYLEKWNYIDGNPSKWAKDEYFI